MFLNTLVYSTINVQHIALCKVSVDWLKTNNTQTFYVFRCVVYALLQLNSCVQVTAVGNKNAMTKRYTTTLTHGCLWVILSLPTSSCLGFGWCLGLAGWRLTWSLLFVHGIEHQTNVRGEEVVHLVAQGCLAEQAAAPYQVTYGDVEVVTATAPVGDLGEGMCVQYSLLGGGGDEHMI